REVVRAVLVLVPQRRSPEALDLRVVHAPGGGDLGVAVNYGASGPPETVPHKERISGLRVFFEGSPHPLESHRDVVVHLLRGEGERVVLVEDYEAVEAV